jgi:hypothetical protein
MHRSIHNFLVFVINGALIFISHRATNFSGPALQEGSVGGPPLNQSGGGGGRPSLALALLAWSLSTRQVSGLS